VRRFDGDRVATSAQIAASRPIFTGTPTGIPGTIEICISRRNHRQHRLATYGALR
jgi:hypothetical protein